MAGLVLLVAGSLAWDPVCKVHRASAWQRAGGELAVNNFTTSSQNFARTAALRGGGAVVVWRSRDQDLAGEVWQNSGVFGRILKPDGTTVKGEFALHEADGAPTDERYPDVTALWGVDRFATVWIAEDDSGSGPRIVGQVFSNDGARKGSQFTVRANYPSSARVSAIGWSGDFVVVFADMVSGKLVLRGQRFRKDGSETGEPFAVSGATRVQQHVAAVKRTSGGGIAAAWVSREFVTASDGLINAHEQIVVRYFDANAEPVSGEVVVNRDPGTRGYFSVPDVAVLEDGKLAITWAYTAGDATTDFDVFVQWVDEKGGKEGAPLVAHGKVQDGKQLHPSIAHVGNNGGVVVAWASFNQDGSGYGVYQQVFTHDAERAHGHEELVNTHTLKHQMNPHIAALHSGGYLVVWESDGQDGSDFGVHAQFYAPVQNPRVQARINWAPLRPDSLNGEEDTMLNPDGAMFSKIPYPINAGLGFFPRLPVEGESEIEVACCAPEGCDLYVSLYSCSTCPDGQAGKRLAQDYMSLGWDFQTCGPKATPPFRSKGVPMITMHKRVSEGAVESVITASDVAYLAIFGAASATPHQGCSKVPLSQAPENCGRKGKCPKKFLPGKKLLKLRLIEAIARRKMSRRELLGLLETVLGNAVEGQSPEDEEDED